jgi:hypothetical protein
MEERRKMIQMLRDGQMKKRISFLKPKDGQLGGVSCLRNNQKKMAGKNKGTGPSYHHTFQKVLNFSKQSFSKSLNRIINIAGSNE